MAAASLYFSLGLINVKFQYIKEVRGHVIMFNVISYNVENNVVALNDVWPYFGEGFFQDALPTFVLKFIFGMICHCGLVGDTLN